MSYPAATQVGVITGASQGIGKTTAEAFDALGWSLVLIDLQQIDLSGYKNAVAFTGDITDENFVSMTAAESFKKFGRIDALVNNAGISNIASALKTSAATYRKVLEANLVRHAPPEQPAAAVEQR